MKTKEIDTKLVMKAVGDVLSTFGIYPQASITIDEKGKETTRTERTEWQEGWNAALMEISKRIYEVEKRIEEEGISDELSLLLIADVGWLHDGKFFLNMNDTFLYACADSEEVTEEEIKDVAGFFANYGYKGLTYWVARKRGFDPDIPRYKNDVDEVRKMEEVK